MIDSLTQNMLKIILVNIICFIFIFPSCTTNKGSDDNTVLIVTITSPESKYYEEYPLLSYKLSRSADVRYFLNDSEINYQAALKNSQTGMNNLRIAATDGSGNQVTAEVDYFMNDLKLIEEDDFDRDNSDEVGSIWFEIDGNSIMHVDNNRLTAKGSTDLTYVALLSHELNYPIEKNILTIDLINISNNGSMLDIGYGNTSSDGFPYGVDLFLVKNNDGNYSMSITELLVTQPDSPLANVLDQKDISMNLAESGKKIIFYRNLNSYSGYILDNNNTIIDSIQVDNYTHNWLDGEFSRNGIGFWPNDDTDTDNNLIECDNYKFFSGNSNDYFINWIISTGSSNYYIYSWLRDPEGRASSVTVTGTGITEPIISVYNDWGWGGQWSGPFFSDFTSSQLSIPYTFNYSINTSNGTIIKSVTINKYLNPPVAVSPVSGADVPASGFTLSWNPATPVGFSGTPSFNYRVSIHEDNSGDLIWERVSINTTSITYDGPTLTAGGYQYYINTSLTSGKGNVSASCNDTFNVP